METMERETTQAVAEPKEEAIEALISLSPEEQAIFEEMIKATVICGRKKSKTNPKMRRYLFTTRKGIELFDLLQTLPLLGSAAAFIKEKVDKKLSILVVGTQAAAKDTVKAFSEKFGFSYVIERWLGGTLTNFRVIAKRIEHFSKLKADRAARRLEKYTKKERLKIDEEIEKLNKIFAGIEKMNQMPEAVFVVDAETHHTAVHEANRMGIPVIAIANSDNNPDKIMHLIPGNDNARASIAWLFSYLEKKIASAPSASALAPAPAEKPVV